MIENILCVKKATQCILNTAASYNNVSTENEHNAMEWN